MEREGKGLEGGWEWAAERRMMLGARWGMGCKDRVKVLVRNHARTSVCRKGARDWEVGRSGEKVLGKASLRERWDGNVWDT